MCYSAGVQLATASILLLSVGVFGFYFKKKYRAERERRFLAATLLVFTCIGGHQLFEFLALTTGNSFIYKTGLIISLITPFFLLRSLEALVNEDLHSSVALWITGLTSIHLLLVPLEFTSASFYVRHFSVFFWAAAWMFLFIYWHVCAFRAARELKANKAVFWYLFAIADLSFLLSAAYVLAGFFAFGVNVCTDAPSIWCTFFVVQTIPLPFFLIGYPRMRLSRTKQERVARSVKATIVALLISLIILGLLIAMLPFFDCLTWKFVFP